MMSEMAGSRRWRRATAAASTAAIGAGLVVVPADVASATTLTVTDSGDSGPNTLRQKVIDAVAGDVIEFDPSIRSITLLGEITIDKSLTIRGPGSDSLTIDGGSHGRVFHAYGGSATPVDVTISQVTLTHGRAAVGGAVYAEGENLTLTDVAIDDNVSTGNGGGVALLGTNGASLTIDDGSTITSNSAATGGGGISLQNVTAPVTITDSTISSNVSGENGTGPTVVGLGGGIWAKQTQVPPPSGVLRIERSSITGNTADPDVADTGQGGGVYTKYFDVTLVGSTVSGNVADHGAGLFVQQRSLSATNATIADNEGDTGGGVYLAGSAAADLESTTIAGNVAATTGGGVYGSGRTVTMRDTVIADNTAPTKRDLEAGTVTATYSLVEVDETSFSPGADGNLTGDPVLGPLADDGRPTATKRPGATSPLIDAGDPAYAGPPSTDQRGEARVQGDAIDIGSVETAAVPTTTTTTPVAPPPAPPASTTVGVPPPGADGSSTVDVRTAAGTITVQLTGAHDDGATVTVTVADGVPTRGFTVLGRVYDVDVDGAGSGGGTLCLPFDPGSDLDADRVPVIVHILPDGTRQALPTTARGGQLCAVVTSFSPFAVALLDTTRLAGVDAASTAAAISASAFEPGVPTAYVVARSRTGDAVAAGAAGGPVLLVDRDGIPDATTDELRRLAPRRIVVVGGTGAVSDVVVTRLGATRVAGRDRFETAAALAQDSHRPVVPVVYVVNGSSIADGLVASAAASHDGGVVLLVERDRVPAAVGAAITALRPDRVVTVGGTAAVSDAVVEALGATRIAGADRYATSANVARAVGDDDLAVARGDEPTDALAGAPLGRPLLLVERNALPPQVRLALTALAARSITILGGTAAVSLDTEAAVAEYLP
ncbi:MAG: N-acetylmuramoyl-L-alanine amidase [Actinomycetia bacterium]|nr:N-acetylmuramoyl-L-alanine amidase [Actinomycetes bacterium]